MQEGKEDQEESPDYQISACNQIWPLMDLNFLENLPPIEDALNENNANTFSSLTIPLPPHQLPTASTIPDFVQPDISKDFDGDYGFTVGYPKQDGSRGTNGSSWIHSEMRDELYVRMNKDCPVHVFLSSPPPTSAFLRVTPVYRRAIDQHIFPTRCPNHSAPNHETNRDHLSIGHVIRSYMQGVWHAVDPQSGRMSLLFPLQYTQSCSPMTYVVRFMCRSSCVGGMNRRPFNLVFTLEHNGQCLGHQVKWVQVCAAPRRDHKNDELRLQRILAGVICPFPNEEVPRPRQPERQLVHLPIAQDVKTACRRVISEVDAVPERNVKRQRIYKIKVSSLRIYNILKDLLPVVEANIRKQDAGNSTSDEDN